MPSRSAHVKNEKQYEALKDKGMSKERAAKIANSPDASHNGGKKSGSGGDSSPGRHHRPTQGRRTQGRQGHRQEAHMNHPGQARIDGPMTTDEPAAIAAGVPLGEVTDDLARQGRDGQFQALDGGQLRCLTCEHRFPASETPATETTRLEGASDPAELSIVIPLRCPHCGTEGALIANYGPEASAAEADVLTALPRVPRNAK